MIDSELSFLKYPGATLSDRDIKLALEAGYLEIQTPPDADLAIQAASIDLHLASTTCHFSRGKLSYVAALDLRNPVEEYMEYQEIDPKEGLILRPGEFILGVTREWFKFPAQLCGSLDGKSSLGRLGCVVHVTAGFFDPGFEGHGTLEITNLTEFPLRIIAGMPIGQMRFSILSSPSEVVYGDERLGSKRYKNLYTPNPHPIPSQFWKNFQDKENKRNGFSLSMPQQTAQG